MTISRMHVLALVLLASGVAVGVSVAQTQHQNGVGQTYSNDTPLGTPGHASSYNVTMAIGAANAWPQTGIVSSATCAVPRNTQMVMKQGTDACAVWAYTGTMAGHVHLNTANNTCNCPTTTDPTWN
jgi:hypothetical protein